jgi:hypothetical protein
MIREQERNIKPARRKRRTFALYATVVFGRQPKLPFVMLALVLLHYLDHLLWKILFQDSPIYGIRSI